MIRNKMTTLSEAMETLRKEGFSDDFKAGEHNIKALYADRNYQPEDLKIIESYRFEGITNPSDESELLAIRANDGTKGTLVMTYGREQSQNSELIKRIDKI